jgi:hypothetical protein
MNKNVIDIDNILLKNMVGMPRRGKTKTKTTTKELLERFVAKAFYAKVDELISVLKPVIIDFKSEIESLEKLKKDYSDFPENREEYHEEFCNWMTILRNKVCGNGE